MGFSKPKVIAPPTPEPIVQPTSAGDSISVASDSLNAEQKRKRGLASTLISKNQNQTGSGLRQTLG